MTREEALKLVDRYRTLDELMGSEVEGQAYLIHSNDRGHSVTVIAPHGGGIEPHTSLIATRIAGADFNVFLFEGILPAGNARLHVSSERFVHPFLEKMLQRSRVAISIHGKQGTDENDEHVGIGGMNDRLAGLMIRYLRRAGIAGLAEPNSALAARLSANFVNRALERGVQLEITLRLREGLRGNEELLASFVGAVREAVANYGVT